MNKALSPLDRGHEVLEVFPASLGQDTIDWGLQTIQAEAAWTVTKGAGVKVAILDTGIDYNHPDLKQNIREYIDFTGSQHGALDVQGHGTHVAGIIAGVDNDTGIIGVAPDAELYVAKVLGDNGSGSFDYIIKGINWAMAHGVDVINMSLGASSEPPAAMHAAIQQAVSQGITIIAATGNENGEVCWPAMYDEVIAVSAIDQNKNKASFSNYGIKNEITAPGVDILSTYKNGGYARLSGTSMATPIITGSVALYISMKKAATGVNPSITDVHGALVKAVDDLGSIGKDEYYGAGLINLVKLLA